MITKDGKVKILGWALKNMLLKDKPPNYFIAYNKDKVIYNFAYHQMELLGACGDIARRLREADTKEIGFGRINGESLLNACKAGGLKPKDIKLLHIYETEYDK